MTNVTRVRPVSTESTGSDTGPSGTGRHAPPLLDLIVATVVAAAVFLGLVAIGWSRLPDDAGLEAMGPVAVALVVTAPLVAVGGRLVRGGNILSWVGGAVLGTMLGVVLLNVFFVGT